MRGKKFTAAVVQAAAPAFDKKAALEKFADLAGQAAGKGADIAVFPEAFIGGYPKGLDFGARVGSRTPEGHEDFLRYWNGAVALAGDDLAALSGIVRKAGIYIALGLIEQGGGTLYCSVAFFAPDGTYMGKHRKVMPTAAERLVWGYGDGSTLPVYDTPLGKLGAVICWENMMPAMRLAMYGKGIEIYCAPTVDDRDTWHASMRHIAREGRCFVLNATQFATRADYPADYENIHGDDPATVMINGGSCIVSPFGEVLAGPTYGEEIILTAEIDMDELPRAKYEFDPVGHYARPDIFELRVDERAKEPVTQVTGDEA